MKKKPWILRPVAWMCTILMMLAMQFVVDKFCLFAERIMIWMDSLSVGFVIVLTILFGGTVLGLVTSSVYIIPIMVVTVSDSIYPSHHAFRYYFVGIYEIVGCAFLIIAGIMGAVTGCSMFWFYFRYIWLILASICMMIMGRSVSNDRQKGTA